MSSAVADLEAGLQAMLQLKPPGVSGSRIQGITTLCTSNVQSESVLIQKLYTHFRKAPGTHKLGVLYVVDSVTRKWTEQAKNTGQPINNDAQDGTFAAGVNRVKELLPALMNDIIQTAPDDQKDKIKKLVDIWEKGQTFPPHMLAQFKDKLNAPPQTSTTPPGSPPKHLQQALGMSAVAAQPVASDKNTSILEALANLARQNNALPPVSSQPQGNPYNVSHTQNNPTFPSVQNSYAIPPQVNVPTPAAPFAPQPHVPAIPNYASSQPNPYAAVPPVVAAPSLDPAMQQQYTLIKALADSGMPPDEISRVLAGAFSQPPPQYQHQHQNHTAPNADNGWGSRPDESRDRNGYPDREAVRSPQDRYRQRSRSRSPARGWNGQNSPAGHRRNDSNLDYADRDRNSPGRNRGDGRGRGRGGGSEYRQRSPPRRGHSLSPSHSGNGGEKWVAYDPTIGKGNIKVLSRTLFVGGVTMPDYELRRIFDKFGTVQTCIVNKDKRHAFVKMVCRDDAVRAKEAMEKNRTPDSQLRVSATRWGVGFGPRECSDYQTGVSIIPISKLTDADRKWMLSAEYGGSGGKPIESGMVVEEPDIEIGQGVSSKAISRRMATDQSGNNGPKSSRDREKDDYGRNRRSEWNDRREDREDNGPPSMPPVPAFNSGFPFLGLQQNGMQMPMAGYPYPQQGHAQPPPPGRH